MSDSANIPGPDVGQLVQDHRDLRASFMELATKITHSIALVDGKVDKSIALLERLSERQDRGEDRVNRIESEVDALREKHEAQREADRANFARQLHEVQTEARETQRKVWMGVGILACISFILPLVLKLLPMIGAD